MNGFVRYTHDENGKYRNLRIWKELHFLDSESCDIGYIHLLTDKYPMTIQDLCNEVNKYNKENTEDGFNDDISFICKSLIVLIQYDMIKVVKINE